MSIARVHDQIVDLITRAHTESESIETKIQSLQQATELMLYQTSGNERIDEFLETFLSMHVNKEPAIRRFSAYFLEMLCFTRSRYACSCLEVLVTLLQDADRQVQIFALRAARVIYKRALYWISVQQRESVFIQAARESVASLDHVLARIVHLITSSEKEVFCESIRCAQSVVLVQSHCSFGSKSQAQLEASGCSSLEDLKLVDSAALDESKLKGQSDRLFTALCALLVKKREERSHEMELITLIHAVGIVGQQRSSYAGAATVAFSELAQQIEKFSSQAKGALVSELKRILASRHCVEWQPRILPVLASLGIVEENRGLDSSAVLRAEMERLKHEVEAESGIERAGKRQKLSGDAKGERLMIISDITDAFKVPDETQAEAVCAVRANTPAELARTALSMLGKLPKHFEDELMALVRVNRASASAGGSASFERRVKAARALSISVSDFISSSDTEMDEENGQLPQDEQKVLTSPPKTLRIEENVDLAAMVDVNNVALFLKLVVTGLNSVTRQEKLDLMRKFLLAHIDSSPKAVIQLFRAVFRGEMRDESLVSTEDLGRCLPAEIGLAQIKNIVSDIPSVPSELVARLDSLISSSFPGADLRRGALTTLASLALSKPGIASDCLNRLLGHCNSPDEAIRTDAIRLLLAKVYRPQRALLNSQWPYSDKCPSPTVDTFDNKISKLEFLCSQELEARGTNLLVHAAKSGEWSKAWVAVALCSKKPQLLHLVLATLIESVPESSSIPAFLMAAFGQALVQIPPETFEPELETLVKQYKSVRAVHKKKMRNEFILPLLSAIAATDRGLTGALADAALSFGK